MSWEARSSCHRDNFKLGLHSLNRFHQRNDMLTLERFQLYSDKSLNSYQVPAQLWDHRLVFSVPLETLLVFGFEIIYLLMDELRLSLHRLTELFNLEPRVHSFDITDFPFHPSALRQKLLSSRRDHALLHFLLVSLKLSKAINPCVKWNLEVVKSLNALLVGSKQLLNILFQRCKVKVSRLSVLFWFQNPNIRGCRFDCSF